MSEIIEKMRKKRFLPTALLPGKLDYSDLEAAEAPCDL